MDVKQGIYSLVELLESLYKLSIIIARSVIKVFTVPYSQIINNNRKDIENYKNMRLIIKINYYL